MLDFPTDSDDRTSTYEENISKATYSITQQQPPPNSSQRNHHHGDDQNTTKKKRFSFRKANSHNQPEVVVVNDVFQPQIHHQPAIPYESSMAVLQNQTQYDQQPPIYSQKPSFHLSESDEHRKLQHLIRRSFILAILSWLCCGGCFYSCLCFLPLYRKNYTFHNVENSFLDDTSSGYGLRKSSKKQCSTFYYENDRDGGVGGGEVGIETEDRTPKGEWKYVMKSFRGNRFRDSPYRSVKQKAENAFDCGFCGCFAFNVLILFWVVALGSSCLIIVLLRFFYAGYSRLN